MNRNIFLILFVALITASCGGSAPSGVLSRDEMGKVLWDVVLAGEYQNNSIAQKYPLLNRAAISNALLDEVLKTNGITKKTFDKSIRYYENNPGKLKIVLDSIMAKQSRLMAIENEQKRKADSVQLKNDSLKLKTDSLKTRKDSLSKQSSVGLTKPVTDTITKKKPVRKKTLRRKKKRVS